MKTRAYRDRLKGHHDVILNISSPHGPNAGILYSISKDGNLLKIGILRVWDLFQHTIISK